MAPAFTCRDGSALPWCNALSVGQNLQLGVPAQRIDALYRRFASRVRWVARARGTPDPVLDDVVHDVFLRAFRTLETRDADVPLPQWLDGITRNVAFSHRRSRARRQARETRIDPPAPPHSPEDLLAHKDAFIALRGFLDGLEAGQREVFILCDVLRTPAPEVATQTGLKLNTVYSRLRLARQRFEARFGEDANARRAADTEPRDRNQHRRAVALLAADLGLKSKAALTATTGILSVWKLATAATLVVGSGVAASLYTGDTSEPRAPSVDNTTRVEAPSVVARAHGSAVPPNTVPPPRSEQPVESTPGPRPAQAQPRVKPLPPPPKASSPTTLQRPDPLAIEVGLLRVARSQLAQGDAASALRTVSEHARRFPDGALEAQRYGIEREAACATGDSARAARASRASNRSSEDPCVSVVETKVGP